MLIHGKNVLRSVQKRTVVSPGHISQISTARQVGVVDVISKAVHGRMVGKLLQILYLERRVAKHVKSSLQVYWSFKRNIKPNNFIVSLFLSVLRTAKLSRTEQIFTGKLLQ